VAVPRLACRVTAGATAQESGSFASSKIFIRVLTLRQEVRERGKGCNECIAETFRWNPVGTQSHPVEPGRQPEASLARRPAMAAAKRRQRLLRPCYRAPKLPHRGSPRRTMVRGPRRHTATAWCAWSCRGLRTGHRHTEIPQEPGTPSRLHLDNDWRGAAKTKAPGPRPASGRVGETNTGARDGTAERRQRSKAGGAAGPRSTP